MNNKKIISIAITCLLFLSCKKDETVDPKPIAEIKTPIVNFNFDALTNNLPFLANTKWYTNSSGDSFNVSKFNYYLSNIKLKRNDGFIFSEPNSYHLIKHVDGVTTFSFANIPEGNYYEIEFLIGVDSLRNVSGSQTGALDVTNNMFWNWNSGYIFFKLEGEYKTNTVTQKGGYVIHIGGFKGVYSCLQKCNFILSTPIICANNKSSNVKYNVNLDELFINPKKIGFDYYYANINDKMFQDLSINYKDMFTVSKIEN